MAKPTPLRWTVERATEVMPIATVACVWKRIEASLWLRLAFMHHGPDCAFPRPLDSPLSH